MVKEISFDEIELRAMGEAYDALKCLPPDALTRAFTWLNAKLKDESSRTSTGEQT